MTETKELTASQHVDLLQKVLNVNMKHENFERWEKEVTRDAVTGRINGPKNRSEDDTGLTVQFSTQKVLHKMKTYEAGGTPQYIDMDFVTVTIPGNSKLTVHTPVTDWYEWRFRKEYDAFKKGTQQQFGTKLDKLGNLTPADIHVLNQQGIYYIEQLSVLSDSANGVIGNFYDLRQRAQQYMSEKSSRVSDERYDKQEKTIDLLTKKLEEVTNLLEKQAKAKTKEAN